MDQLQDIYDDIMFALENPKQSQGELEAGIFLRTGDKRKEGKRYLEEQRVYIRQRVFKCNGENSLLLGKR